ncbi:MAG: hypothetical protein KKA55_11850 [Proteobacteria bacterium]|nr:hypothetical protein [Pseudomonadota bacterium]MBU1596210.1 hypothetical protein [Pseudomonadota bacterium]
MRPENRQPVREQVLEALGQSQDSLHELDYEDVALSAAGLQMVRQAAATVLRRLTGMAAEDLPLARALALFLDHVFWNESTGGLILCADLPEKSVCLPIPSGCWGIKPHAGRVQ